MLRRLFSWLFILISKTRSRLYKKGLFKSIKITARVISVGNISMGGSGKTPMVLKLVNDAVNKDLKTVVIEKGYKSDLGRNEVLCLEKGKDTSPGVDKMGDEAKMVWDTVPNGTRLCVSKNKAQGAAFCQNKWSDTDLVIVDDGFQHLALKRDVDVVLIDAVKGFEDKVFPSGILREPYSVLQRATVVVFTKSDDLSVEDLKALSQKAASYNPKLKIFFAKTRFYSNISLDGKKILPVSAVYNGAHFRKKLKNAGAIFEKYMEYPDHRSFTDKDVKEILAFKKRTEAQIIAVTKKDWAKLERLIQTNEPVALCWYEHTIQDQEEFLKCCIGY